MMGMMMSSTSADDLAEPRADDHADGEVEGVALRGQFFEFLPHASRPGDAK
jgi:hypothetical protein